MHTPSTPTPASWRLPAWVAGLILCTTVGLLAVVLGKRVDIIGLLIVGPCTAMLSGRARPTAAVSGWATLLAVAIGFVNGIEGTFEHLAFVSAVAVVAVGATAAAAAIQRCQSPTWSFRGVVVDDDAVTRADHRR